MEKFLIIKGKIGAIYKSCFTRVRRSTHDNFENTTLSRINAPTKLV